MFPTMMSHKLMAWAVVALAMTAVMGCSSGNSPKSVVNEFLDSYVSDGYNVSEKQFSRPDSTFFITDSIIRVMHKKAQAMPEYSKNITYSAHESGKKLIYITLKFRINGKPCSQTFYIDEGTNGVVAFKDNGMN